MVRVCSSFLMTSQVYSSLHLLLKKYLFSSSSFFPIISLFYFYFQLNQVCVIYFAFNSFLYFSCILSIASISPPYVFLEYTRLTFMRYYFLFINCTLKFSSFSLIFSFQMTEIEIDCTFFYMFFSYSLIFFSNKLNFNLSFFRNIIFILKIDLYWILFFSIFLHRSFF